MKSSLHKAAQTLIRKTKNNKSYILDKNIRFISIAAILFERLVMLLRGLAIAPFLGNFSTPLFLGRRVRIKSKRMLSIGKGCTLADDVVIDCLSKNGIKIGDNVSIPNHTYIRCTGVISNLGEGLLIGNGSGLGHYNFINAQGGVYIGENVIVGPFVKILAENHVFSDPTLPIKLQGVSRKGITIKDNVWIGASSTILDGVTIESGAVVAAGALVNRDVQANAVVAGVPARVIKIRESSSTYED
jgi:acetyltransferase-like isoleucine patch superfamily enzyme